MRNSAAYEEAYHYKPMKPMNFKSPSASHKSYKPNREALLAAAKRNLGQQDLGNQRSATEYLEEICNRRSNQYQKHNQPFAVATAAVPNPNREINRESSNQEHIEPRTNTYPPHPPDSTPSPPKTRHRRCLFRLTTLSCTPSLPDSSLLARSHKPPEAAPSARREFSRAACCYQSSSQTRCSPTADILALRHTVLVDPLPPLAATRRHSPPQPAPHQPYPAALPVANQPRFTRPVQPHGGDSARDASHCHGAVPSTVDQPSFAAVCCLSPSLPISSVAASSATVLCGCVSQKLNEEEHGLIRE
ncbi:hypothetical protein Droror1_Dr00024663 [Drosera rotundifolia]